MSLQVRTPKSVQSIDRGSTPGWTLTPAVEHDDNTPANCALEVSGQTSSLRIYNFAFSVPTAATIVGIRVRVKAKATHTGIG